MLRARDRRNPDKLTEDTLRSVGYTVEKCTWRHHKSRTTTIDLYGCMDYLAISNTRTVGVQATTSSNVTARMKKYDGSEKLKAWIKNPSREFFIVGWYMDRIPGHGQVADVRKAYIGHMGDTLYVRVDPHHLFFDERPEDQGGGVDHE